MRDDEWAFVAPDLALVKEEAKQRQYPLREVFNGLRYLGKTGGQWRSLPHDLPPWPVVYQQTQRWLVAGCFAALLHDLRALLRLAEGRAVHPRAAIAVVKVPAAKRGFVLLPRRWVVERSFAWTTRFRRLARDDERRLSTLAGLHLGAFTSIELARAVPILWLC